MYHRVQRSQPGLTCTKSSRHSLQPSIQITAESIDLLHRGLIEQKDLYLPYSHLQQLLALGHKRITESGGHSLDSATIPKLTKTVIEDLTLPWFFLPLPIQQHQIHRNIALIAQFFDISHLITAFYDLSHLVTLYLQDVQNNHRHMADIRTTTAEV